MSSPLHPLDAEWLEADGLGGFASGTVSGIRTRRYHALLLAATMPPSGRMVLVNGLDAWVDLPSGTFALSSQRYSPDVVHPDGLTRLENFVSEPWPRWTWRLTDDLCVEHELFSVNGTPSVAMSWKLVGETDEPVTLRVRPFLSGRDFHALHHENEAFRFHPEESFGRVTWRPYPGVPCIVAHHNGKYDHKPCWYRNFLYVKEQERGLDYLEDLAAPGEFAWDLHENHAALVFVAGDERLDDVHSTDQLLWVFGREEASRRKRFTTPLHRAADAYLVKRRGGATVIAGYPWFGDWGRDTFIALRGLFVATGRTNDALGILVSWAREVSEGMLPNRFPERSEQPEFNSVDASLWYVIAVDECLGAANEPQAEVLREAVGKILTGYRDGTRFGIRADSDGLLLAGQPGLQLTWMDAKVGDRVITPRIGKPVEIQALWINALHCAAKFDPAWQPLFEKARAAFQERFWHEETGYLLDVADPDDSSLRPNQIFAIGGLPLVLLDADKAQRVVEIVEQQLLTPLGLRTLAPGSPEYAAHYEGGVIQRDAAYHQGTAWPWLMGAFVEAWIRVRGGTDEAKAAARERFIVPLHAQLDQAGIGHLSEIADAEAPFTPRGCPFQAWSLGELLRLEKICEASAPQAAE